MRHHRYCLVPLAFIPSQLRRHNPQANRFVESVFTHLSNGGVACRESSESLHARGRLLFRARADADRVMPSACHSFWEDC
jgi:hypothetical protein